MQQHHPELQNGDVSFSSICISDAVEPSYVPELVIVSSAVATKHIKTYGLSTFVRRESAYR